MDLPKKTIGILLPGEQNGKRKKKRKAKAKAAQRQAREEGYEANRRSRPKIFRAHLRGDSRQDESNQRTRKQLRRPTPSTWQVTRTAKARLSALIWRTF